MTKSYSATLDLLAQGQVGKASLQFKMGFLPAVVDMNAKAAKTYPTRFAKIDNWCAFVENVHARTVKADKALTAGKRDEAQKEIETVRALFYAMHKETKTTNAADIIYGFRQMAGVKKPQAAYLAAFRKALDSVKPPATTLKDKKVAAAYQQAKTSWATQVAAVLADNNVAPAEIAPLRKATESFYKQFGRQFE